MEIYSDSDVNSTPECIKTAANEIINNLLPQKSRDKYLKAYENFIMWRNERRVKSLSESVFLTYFSEMSKKMRPSSLWSIYSMLKSTVNTKHNVDIKEYSKLTSLLKRLSDGYMSKKSKVLTAQDIETFLNEASDDKYLATKVALIFGINGACRSSELMNITIENIETHNQMLLIKLMNTKTKKDRQFVIRDDFLNVVQKYMALRPSSINTNRFFLNYQNGKCSKQAIGRNKFGKLPYEIASYLKLQNPEAYTGHCFRRTSATLLADSGANLTTLKRHGGWKSDQVAEGYIEESVQNKSKITQNITESIHLHRSTSPRPSTSHGNDLKLSPRLPVSSDSDDNNYYSQINHTNTRINVPSKSANFTFNNCTFNNCKF